MSRILNGFGRPAGLRQGCSCSFPSSRTKRTKFTSVLTSRFIAGCLPEGPLRLNSSLTRPRLRQWSEPKPAFDRSYFGYPVRPSTKRHSPACFPSMRPVGISQYEAGESSDTRPLSFRIRTLHYMMPETEEKSPDTDARASANDWQPSQDDSELSSHRHSHGLMRRPAILGGALDLIRKPSNGKFKGRHEKL